MSIKVTYRDNYRKLSSGYHALLFTVSHLNPANAPITPSHPLRPPIHSNSSALYFPPKWIHRCLCLFRLLPACGCSVMTYWAWGVWQWQCELWWRCKGQSRARRSKVATWSPRYAKDFICIWGRSQQFACLFWRSHSMTICLYLLIFRLMDGNQYPCNIFNCLQFNTQDSIVSPQCSFLSHKCKINIDDYRNPSLSNPGSFCMMSKVWLIFISVEYADIICLVKDNLNNFVNFSCSYCFHALLQIYCIYHLCSLKNTWWSTKLLQCDILCLNLEEIILQGKLLITLQCWERTTTNQSLD